MCLASAREQRSIYVRAVAVFGVPIYCERNSLRRPKSYLSLQVWLLSVQVEIPYQKKNFLRLEKRYR